MRIAERSLQERTHSRMMPRNGRLWPDRWLTSNALGDISDLRYIVDCDYIRGIEAIAIKLIRENVPVAARGPDSVKGIRTLDTVERVDGSSHAIDSDCPAKFSIGSPEPTPEPDMIRRAPVDSSIRKIESVGSSQRRKPRLYPGRIRRPPADCSGGEVAATKACLVRYDCPSSNQRVRDQRARHQKQ